MFLETLKNRHANNECGRALLIDPDKAAPDHLDRLLANASQHRPDYIFVGGSLLTTDGFSRTVSAIKQRIDVPVVIFPGSLNQIDKKADAFLLISLVSGRNPELLIGEHVKAAPILKSSGLEIWSTAYLIIDGGKPTTASYMSNTAPIPADKPEIAVSTALAAEMLGFKLIYLDAGSGAEFPVSPEIIKAVKKNVNLPLIVGGGINSPEKAKAAADAGANLVVLGNAIEKKPEILSRLVSQAAL